MIDRYRILAAPLDTVIVASPMLIVLAVAAHRSSPLSTRVHDAGWLALLVLTGSALAKAASVWSSRPGGDRLAGGLSRAACAVYAFAGCALLLVAAALHTVQVELAPGPRRVEAILLAVAVVALSCRLLVLLARDGILVALIWLRDTGELLGDVEARPSSFAQQHRPGLVMTGCIASMVALVTLIGLQLESGLGAHLRRGFVFQLLLTLALCLFVALYRWASTGLTYRKTLVTTWLPTAAIAVNGMIVVTAFKLRVSDVIDAFNVGLLVSLIVVAGPLANLVLAALNHLITERSPLLVAGLRSLGSTILVVTLVLGARVNQLASTDPYYAAALSVLACGLALVALGLRGDRFIAAAPIIAHWRHRRAGTTLDHLGGW